MGGKPIISPVIANTASAMAAAMLAFGNPRASTSKTITVPLSTAGATGMTNVTVKASTQRSGRATIQLTSDRITGAPRTCVLVAVRIR